MILTKSTEKTGMHLWQGQPWYPDLLRLSRQLPLLEKEGTERPKSLLKRDSTASGSSITSTLAVSIITGENYVIQTFLSKLLHLFQAREGRALYQITCQMSNIKCHAHIDEKPVGHHLFLLNDRNFQQLTQKAAPFVCVECRISFEVYKEQLRKFWELIREVFDI